MPADWLSTPSPSIPGTPFDKLLAAPLVATSLLRHRLGWFNEPLLPLANWAAPITPTTSVGTATISANANLRAWDSGKFTYPAGDAKLAGGSYPDYLCCRHQNITTSLLVQHIVAEFDFYGQAFEVYGKRTTTGPASQIRVIADDQIVHAGRGYSPGGVSGDMVYALFDLGSFARRRIRVEAVYFYFAGINALNTCSIQPIDYSGYPLAIGVGDSYEEGTGSSHQWDAATVMAARRVGLRRYWPSGVGATGYLANGGGGGKTTYRGRIQSDVIAYNPDVVFISGSINDNSTAANLVQAEAALLFSQITQALPGAALIVTGVYPYGNPPAQAVLNNAAIKTECLKVGGIFIDPIAGPGGPWIFGTGNSSAPNNTGNSDWAADNTTHPTFAGHLLFSDRKTNALRAALR